MSRYRITVGDTRHAALFAAEGQKLRCEIDGIMVSGTLIQITPPYYALQLDDGQLLTGTITTQGSATLITSQGQTWSGTVAESFGDSDLADDDGDAASTELRASMPGRVVAVHHKSGVTVSKGDALIVIEAMKMQNALTSPRTGIIDKIHVKIGDAVEAGQLLAVISISRKNQKNIT